VVSTGEGLAWPAGDTAAIRTRLFKEVRDELATKHGLDTADETVERASAFAEQIGKTAIKTKDRSGFIVNFLLVPYLMAAVRMYEEGFASREDIDDGMRLGAGHPMGPLRLADMVGLDTFSHVAANCYASLTEDEDRKIFESDLAG